MRKLLALCLAVVLCLSTVTGATAFSWSDLLDRITGGISNQAMPSADESTSPVTPSETTFSDVSADNWAWEYIERAAAKGWVTGMGDGTFHPEDPLTYAEMTALMTRYLFPEKVAALPVDQPWYLPYVELAMEEDLLTHSKLDSYNRRCMPTDLVNRYEMATMLYRILVSLQYLPHADQLRETRTKREFRHGVDHIPTYSTNTSDCRTMKVTVKLWGCSQRL